MISRNDTFRASGAGWLAGLILAWLVPSSMAAEVRVYRGCCDASAGVALNDDLMAVASDEENTLRLYRRDAGGLPVATTAILGGSGRGPGRSEIDIEGAARLDDLVFWIGSHSRNSDGKPRPARHALFATRIIGTGTSARLEPAGLPYRGLVAALSASPALGRFQFSRAAERAGEAPGGLNIEALAAGVDGRLWIGFRNPVPEKQALLVPLLNPREVIAGGSPGFGSPVLLSLGGLGLRDAVRVGDKMVLLAGPAEGGGRHRLYLWQEGAAMAVEVTGAVPKGFQAESVVSVGGSDSRRLEILSDDGGERTGGVRCSDLVDPVRRTFRSLRVAF